MRLLLISAFALLITSCKPSFSQDIKMTKEVKELVALGKDSLIQLALKSANHWSNSEKVSSNTFFKVAVKTNGEEVIVQFLNPPIMYVPLNTVFQGNIGVFLIRKSATSGEVENLSENQSTEKPNAVFYKETELAKQNKQFVIDALVKSGEFSDDGIKNFENLGEQMIIREKENYYYVTVDAKAYSYSCNVDKKSGKASNIITGHKASPPFKENNKKFIEIY